MIKGKTYLAMVAFLVFCLVSSAVASNKPLAEIEPYLNYVGSVLEGNTLYLSSKELENIKNVKIADIEGAVSYSFSDLGKVLKSVSFMQWRTNEIGLSEECFEKICTDVLRYYDVDTAKLEHDSGTIRCKHEIYTITCERINGAVFVEWRYNTDQYNKNLIAGKNAVEILRKKLKNPASLQVHEIAYARNAYCSECKGAVALRIDYSAQNGFGGYNRDFFYAYINPEDYTEVQTFLRAETTLDDNTFTEISIQNLETLKRSYQKTMKTSLMVMEPNPDYPMLESIMDERLASFLNYLKTPFGKSGFNRSEASNIDGSRFSLDDAVF